MSMPEKPESPAASVRWLLWTSVVLVLVASFAVSFAANAPAGWVVQRLDLALSEDAASGTLMHGQIALDGGFALQWDVRPWASAMRLRLAADVTLRGPATDIGGPVAMGLSSYDIGPLTGSADALVLGAIFPGITLRCSGPVLAAGLRVEMTRRTVTGEGTLRTDALACEDGAQTIPAMTLSFTPLGAGTVANVTAGALPVVTATASGDGRLAVVLHKAGAALIPGLPTSADSSIEMPLSSFFR